MITNIRLKSLRRLKNISLNTNHKLIIFVGPNAIGKTTILEGIYVAAVGSSFKTRNFKELIRFNDSYTKISLTNDDNVYNVILSESGRKMLINGNSILKLSDYIGHFQTVLFSPTDVNFVKGEKGIRRSFFDLEISLRDKNYLKLIQDYKKILKKRNELLRLQNFDEILLDTLTKEMNKRQIKIIELREKMIQALNNEFKNLKNVLGYEELIEIKYLKSVTSKDLDDFYLNKLEYDKSTHITNFGVHRDNYVFYLNDLEVSQYASEGQLRSVALILKIALANLTFKLNNIQPALLLDDVFSCLDDKRCSYLVKYLLDQNQALITTTSIENIPSDLIHQAYIINLKE